MPKRNPPRPPGHPDLFDNAPLGQKAEPHPRKADPCSQPETHRKPPLWRRALKVAASCARVVEAATIGLLGRLCRKMLEALESWIARTLLGLVLATVIGANVPAFYWPTWVWQVPVIRRLVPVVLPPWQVEIMEER